jgi:hypothetical protein
VSSMTNANDLTNPHAATRDAFQHELSQHGFGFQHAVIDRARKLYGTQGSLWEVIASEVPVNLGTGTRIDVVMRLKKMLASTLLVGECKKVNPAYSTWCFIPSPFTHANRLRDHEQLSLECLSYKKESAVGVEHRHGIFLDPAYSIGLAIKEAQPGDSQPKRGSSSDAIEDAATQVMRGTNGLVNALVTYPDMLAADRLNILLPVIFTTAKLFVSNANLANSLLDGNMDLSGESFEQVPWLWYQSHASPGLKHAHPLDRDPIKSFEGLMDTFYIRTIAVVGQGGLEPFLRWTTDRDFGVGRFA